MKLDPDMVREILLTVEAEHIGPDSSTSYSSGDDYARFYVARLLSEAGYLQSYDLPDSSDGDITILVIERLTFRGHEFLDSVRDAGIWAEAKAGGKSIGGATLEMLMSLAKGFAKKKLEQHFDLKL